MPDRLLGQYTRVLHRAHIERFKAHWPCHGLPDRLARLECDFDGKGDLTDLRAYNLQGWPMDTHEFDGPALLALVEDCERVGKLKT